MLKVEALEQSYGSKQVLKGLSANFGSGLVHGIIGLNGAGKTTFFQCICGLQSYRGKIYDTELSSLKNHIGYVPTEPYFFPRIKGKEYLEFMRHAKGSERRGTKDAFTFDLPLDEYIDNYSTGMKRKIAFLGAMIGRSDIYILDEPFNGVDIKSNLLLKKKILELKAEGKTILLSSHIISSLTELCDEIHLLKEGVISKHYLPGAYNTVEEDMMNE
jgi:ABC-2 type transport system ATP-binding protein